MACHPNLRRLAPKRAPPPPVVAWNCWDHWDDLQKPAETHGKSQFYNVNLLKMGHVQ